MARPKVPVRKYPTVKVGNYAAPVDTTGMDPEMKVTMGAEPDSAVIKVKKPGIDWWKLLGIKH